MMGCARLPVFRNARSEIGSACSVGCREGVREKSREFFAELLFQQNLQQVGCLHASLSGKRVKGLDEFHIQPGLNLPLMIGSLVGHTRYALLNPCGRAPAVGAKDGSRRAPQRQRTPIPGMTRDCNDALWTA